MMKVEFDHEGWFLFCPVYFRMQDNFVYPKHKLHFVLEVAMLLQEFRNYCLSMVDPDLAFYPFKLKELNPPRVIEVPDEEIF